MVEKPPPEVQVLVAGGGPAGLATALGLRRRGIEVMVAEAAGYTGFRAGEHLDPAGVALLRRTGLPASLWEPGSLPCPGVLSCWGAAEAELNDTFTNPHGEGRILDRPAFDARLAAFAEEAGVRRLEARLVAARRDGGGWRAELRSVGRGCECRAAFLVDATGRGAHLATRLGARFLRCDRLVGVAARLEPRRRRRQDNWLLIEAGEEGWFYAAPLAGERLLATLMTDADRLAGRSPRDLWQACREKSPQLRQRTRHYGELQDLHVRAAHSGRLDRAAGEDWLAVGDAAIAFDPLSSAGIRKGFELGQLAAAAIAAAIAGDPAALAAYDRQVQESFGRYLAYRKAYYRLEQRWPDSPFWHRRHQPQV
jgi:flavin-dependent dehydrogenase